MIITLRLWNYIGIVFGWFRMMFDVVDRFVKLTTLTLYNLYLVLSYGLETPAIDPLVRKPQEPDGGHYWTLGA